MDLSEKYQYNECGCAIVRKCTVHNGPARDAELERLRDIAENERGLLDIIKRDAKELKRLRDSLRGAEEEIKTIKDFFSGSDGGPMECDSWRRAHNEIYTRCIKAEAENARLLSLESRLTEEGILSAMYTADSRDMKGTARAILRYVKEGKEYA